MSARLLWMAVIKQAIDDASQGKADAKHWLLYNDTDFNKVCYFAGLRPTAVREAITKRLAR